MRPWSVPSATSQIYGSGYSAASAPPSQWKRPFGALCSYIGYVADIGGPQPSVDQYPNYVYPTPGQPVAQGEQFANAGPPWFAGFYSKYLVACLWRTKLVYLGMGLKHVWNTINNLYGMCGQAPQPGPCFGDWSLKEVFGMLGSANKETFPLTARYYPQSGPPRLTEFFAFMNTAVPLPSTPYTSLRAVLQA